MTIKYILLLYMPTIPLYNQGATEEAGLTRAKRRVIKAMKSGITKLTEKPDEDLTNGKADIIANNLVGQFEDLTALSRQVSAFLGDGTETIELDNKDDAVKALRLVIISAKAVARILRTVKLLAPSLRYIDLGILSDLKAVQEECNQAMFASIRAMRSLDFRRLEQVFDDIGNYDDPELDSFVSEWDDDATSAFTADSDSQGIFGVPRRDSRSVSTGSTGTKSSKSGSTVTKRTPVGKKQGRVNTMFRYMFGAAEELARPMGTSLDRPPPGGKGQSRPRPRGMRPPQEVEDVEMTRAINRGAMMAQLEEEEFQAKEQGLALLQQTAQQDAEQKAADDALYAQLNEQKEADLKPFARFGVESYERLVDLLSERYIEASNILFTAYENFNAYRQQKVLPARAADADVGNAVKTGAGMYGGFDMSRVQSSNSRLFGNKVYTVGGSSNILYEREGLPRFL